MATVSSEREAEMKIELTDAQVAVLREGLVWLSQHIDNGVSPWLGYDEASPEVPGVLTHEDGWRALISGTDDQLRATQR